MGCGVRRLPGVGEDDVVAARRELAEAGLEVAVEDLHVLGTQARDTDAELGGVFYAITTAATLLRLTVGSPQWKRCRSPRSGPGLAAIRCA